MNNKILDTYTLTELKRFVSNSNIKKYSKLKKDDLIKLMLKDEHKHNFLHLKPKDKKPKEKTIKDKKPKEKTIKDKKPKEKTIKNKKPKTIKDKKPKEYKIIKEKTKEDKIIKDKSKEYNFISKENFFNKNKVEIIKEETVTHIKYFYNEILIDATIYKETNTFNLNIFIGSNKKKGGGRYSLCSLIRYLIKIKELSLTDDFELTASLLKDFKYTKKFSQKKLNEYYKSIGFTKYEKTNNFFTSINNFLKKCDTFKFLD